MRKAIILLVEDNLADQNLVKEAFKESGEGTQLFIVDDGVDALIHLRERSRFSESHFPDLIILDLNLPRKNGRELLIEIRQDPRLSKLLVLVFTSSDSEEELEEMKRLGPDFVVVKPTDLNQYFTSVQAMEHFCLESIRSPERIAEWAKELRKTAA